MHVFLNLILKVQWPCICMYVVFIYTVESRLKTDPELKKKLLSVAATLQEGQNSLVDIFPNINIYSLCIISL